MQIYIYNFLVFTCLVCNSHSEKDGTWKQNNRKLTLYFFVVSKIHKCIHMYDSPQIRTGESMDHTMHYTAARWIFSNLIEKSSWNASGLSPYLTCWRVFLTLPVTCIWIEAYTNKFKLYIVCMSGSSEHWIMQLPTHSVYSEVLFWDENVLQPWPNPALGEISLEGIEFYLDFYNISCTMAKIYMLLHNPQGENALKKINHIASLCIGHI